MDADKVKLVEFSRRVRGYDVGQVDAFLEEMETTLRRGRLELENLQHKLDELSGARDAQSEKLSILNGQILLVKEENQHLVERIAQLEKELEEKNTRIAELEKQPEPDVPAPPAQEKPVEPARPSDGALPPWEEPVDNKVISLENVQKRLRDVGNVAKDSFGRLKSLRKK